MAPPPPASLAMPRGAKVGKGVIVVESRGDEKRCEVVTGKPLSADPLMRHLETKLRPLYGV